VAAVPAKRLNLGTKFILLSSTLVLATALVIGVYVIRNDQRANYEFLLEHGRTLSVMIAQNVNAAIEREDTSSIRHILDLISSDPSIAYIFVLNSDERVLTYKTAEGHPIHIPPLSRPRAGRNAILHQPYFNKEDGKHYVNIMSTVLREGSRDRSIMPVSSGQAPRVIGYVHIGISQEGIKKRVAKSVYSILLFTTLIIVLGISATVLISRRIVAPIHELHEATKEIAEGKLDRQIVIQTNDEVSDLARAFNAMLVQLKISQAKVARNTEELTIAVGRMRQEIAEREKTAQALKDSEKKYRAIFEESKDVIFIANSHGKFLDINRAGAELFAYPSTTALKSCDPPRDLYDDPEGHTVLLRMLERQGFVKDHEVRMKRSDGERLIVLITASAVQDEGSQERIYRGVMHDVTEKRTLEQQLVQSQKMEAIGQLAGGIAHDFNNILTAIMGYANLLMLDIPENSPLTDHADHILSSAERAANLTRSLLAFSRKQVISPKPANLNEIVTGLDGLLRRLIGEDIELRADTDDQDVIIMADSGQIEQVLINLCTNARDAMPGGGKLNIAISTLIVKEDAPELVIHKPGAYALVSVSDTGSGIDERIREKIFEPFFTTKETGKGTGLGLSIVYGIIKQHNGFITVHSEPGCGTTFKLYLPLVGNAGAPLVRHQASRPKGGTETILVAEDDGEVRKLIRLVLAGNGYRVIEAVDGQDALAILSGNEAAVDLLLLDVIMPKKNGKEVYDTVRMTDPDVKAIFMSGYTADIIDKKGILDENLNFLAKPIEPLELLGLIRTVLDG
jgi:PAS domain S-box-containing protein